ncbi:hypothetical protein EBZ38_13050 [bacterium]|nr:hypothetical protein [bacterium]NDC95243.1 hypothetical protein [bacterium]NDD85185.1 hypothetical protein [bacterium]NDG19116.1 hypothetical protein [Betaproteobacteria bacterium]
MALKKSVIKTQAGFSGQLVAPDAYWRVDQVYGNKNEIRAVVNAFVANEQVDTKKYVFKPSLVGDNFIKQAYEFIKQQPEFAGAEDC